MRVLLSSESCLRLRSYPGHPDRHGDTLWDKKKVVFIKPRQLRNGAARQNWSKGTREHTQRVYSRARARDFLIWSDRETFTRHGATTDVNSRGKDRNRDDVGV